MSAKTDKEILETYCTIIQSSYGNKWYLKNDSGLAAGGVYYYRENIDAMLNNIKKSMWRSITSPKTTNPYGTLKIAKFAGT